MPSVPLPIPVSLRNLLLDWRERVRLLPLGRADGDVSRLRVTTAAWVEQVMRDSPTSREWSQVEGQLAALGLAELVGGVNPGDRRALFHLVRALRPQQVLEVGTHVGASTVHIAAALRCDAAGSGRLTTVDVLPVNDPSGRPWEKYGSKRSPAQMVAELGMTERVRFVTQPSTEFLANAGEEFDFIFLDGDHSAATVWREVPAALRRLRAGGVILLHDYYPDGRALWSDGVVIPGPYRGVGRLIADGARLRIVPMGALPWPTKHGSSVTSLAVVTKDE